MPGLADPVIFSRPLPISNLNNVAGDDRSNVSWADEDNTLFYGDDFKLAANPLGSYRITKLSVWSVPLGDPSEWFSKIVLYGGRADPSGGEGGTVELIPATVTNTQVDYVGGVQYEGNSGAFYPVYRTDFAVDWVVAADTLYQFGIWTELIDPIENFDLWFNHASNAALSGNSQQGADNLYRSFDSKDLGAGAIFIDSNGNGWDKSSDINVEIEGYAVPEPGSLLLLGAGLAALMALRRRR